MRSSRESWPWIAVSVLALIALGYFMVQTGCVPQPVKLKPAAPSVPSAETLPRLSPQTFFELRALSPTDQHEMLAYVVSEAEALSSAPENAEADSRAIAAAKTLLAEEKIVDRGYVSAIWMLVPRVIQGKAKLQAAGVSPSAGPGLRESHDGSFTFTLADVLNVAHARQLDLGFLIDRAEIACSQARAELKELRRIGRLAPIALDSAERSLLRVEDELKRSRANVHGTSDEELARILERLFLAAALCDYPRSQLAMERLLGEKR